MLVAFEKLFEEEPYVKWVVLGYEYYPETHHSKLF